MPSVILQVIEIMNLTLEIKNYSIRICHINHWLYFIKPDYNTVQSHYMEDYSYLKNLNLSLFCFLLYLISIENQRVYKGNACCCNH